MPHAVVARPDTSNSVAVVGNSATRLDLCELEGVAQELCKASLSINSQKAYQTAQRQYFQFCHSFGISPLPASEQVLILFVADISSRVCHSTARSYLSAVRHLHISNGYGDPLKGALQLDLVLRGLKRKKPRGQDTRLPITPWILMQIREVLMQKPHDFDNIMLWAACCLAFFAFLRAGEFTIQAGERFDPSTHLTPRDIEVDDLANPSMLKIRIKMSKTDQWREGVDLFVGKTENELCPVAAILAFLAIRGQDNTPLFKTKEGTPLSRQMLVKLVKDTLSEAGIDCSRYNGHSFRIGAATMALAKGIPESTIQTLGRWKSNAYRRYIRIPRDQLTAFSVQMSSSLNV